MKQELTQPAGDESVGLNIRTFIKPAHGFISRVLTQLAENVLAVVLIAILVSIGFGAVYGARWVEHTAIPNHDARIQEGYERITQQFIDATQAQNEKFTSTLIQVRTDNSRDMRAITSEFTKDRERDREMVREIREMLREMHAEEHRTGNKTTNG